MTPSPPGRSIRPTVPVTAHHNNKMLEKSSVIWMESTDFNNRYMNVSEFNQAILKRSFDS